MIKAVIFDLNGIFIQSPRLSERFEKDFKIPVADFIPKLAEIMARTRHPGAQPSFHYWKPVLAGWKVDLSEKEFWDYWFKEETVSEAMVEFARELKKKGIQVFVLSNNFKERAEYYEHYPWMKDAIDKAYFSWKTGFVKPDVHAWRNVLSENKLKAEECLYFDDQDKNVKASESVGIKSFMFTNEAELEKIVRSYLKK